MEKKITRKNFLKFSTILIGAPLVLSLNSCSNIVEPANSENISKLDKAISGLPSHNVKNTLNKANDQATKVPAAVVYSCYNNKSTVLRLVRNNNQLMLQNVMVKIVSRSSDYAEILGVNNGDVLFINPKQVIKSLARIDKVGLRKRFLRLKKY